MQDTQEINEFEILVIRNTCVDYLYDVIKVDFIKEDVEFLAKGLDFKQAIGLKIELEETF